MRIERTPGFPPRGTPGLFWLGQAGFWIDTGAHCVLIDPYLSDSLARKYAGRKHDHVRMMPPPITVADLPQPDLVLVTHGHTDHLDPDTLGPLHRRFADLSFVVPASCQSLARDRIGADAPLILVDADTRIQPLPGLTVTVFPAAHEALETDAVGHHKFLGYGLATDDLRVFHSGDSIPFDGLPERIAGFAPDICLLPVNGRDATRKADGVPGNFHLDEALTLSAACPFLVPHHFGMFAFNTIDPERIDAAAAQASDRKILRPQAGETLAIQHE